MEEVHNILRYKKVRVEKTWAIKYGKGSNNFDPA